MGKRYLRRVEKNKTFKKTKNDANVSSTFLGEIGEIRQVTKISRTKLDKSLSSFDTNFRIKDKKGV